MSRRSRLSTVTVAVPTVLAVVAVLALLAACGGPAAEHAGPKPSADAADGAAPAVEGEAPAPDAVASRAPGEGAPPPPSPLPALNDFADGCLRVEPPEDGTEIGFFMADCSAQLLETLRACIGALRLPEEEVGDSLGQAEIAVRHLSAGVEAQPRANDVAGRAASAATALADLARATSTVAAEYGGATGDANAQAALESAAGALDGEAPLADQRAGVATFLARADDVVRPLARSGGL